MMETKMDQMDQGEDNSVTPPLFDKSEKNEKKRGPLGRMWSATLNNWHDSDLDQLDQIFRSSTWPAAMGREVGESGTRHLQMWVDFGKRVRPSEMKCFKGLKIHWGDAKGRPQKTEDKFAGPTYCSKEDKEARMYNGAKPRREIKWPSFDKWWQKELLDIIATEPDDRTIYWYWSSEKGIGKTTFAKYLCRFHNACLLDGKKADIKNGALTWKQNNGAYPDLCLWNIPAALDEKWISLSALEQIKDALFYSGKYEGGVVADPCPHVICFANVPPPESEMDPERYVIKCLDKKEDVVVHPIAIADLFRA